MTDTFLAELKEKILNEATFVRATFSGQRPKAYVPWAKVTIRPVLITKQKHLQFSYFESSKNVVKNYTGAALQEQLEQLLAYPFKNYNVEAQDGNFRVQFTKKGKAILHRDKANSRPQAQSSLDHDRRKARMLPTGSADPFLQAVGIMTAEGKIRPGMRSKYRQINEFLKLVDDAVQPSTPNTAIFRVVDFGCGNAYLSFAVYHHFSRFVTTELIGVDIRTDLLQKQAEALADLGWQGLRFHNSTIIDYVAAAPADLVLALHACDTATDEALAQAISMESQFIFAVPCCHHHVQQQLEQQPTPAHFAAVMRYGLLKEAMGDIVTDALRAAILRIMGYKTDVVHFVASEHTPKNLMIRATRSAPPGNAAAVQEYLALRDFWQVSPYLASLLGGALDRYLPKATSQSPPPAPANHLHAEF